MDFAGVKALKTSLWSEVALKSANPQVTCDDFWLANGPNPISGDDLFVEGLLDFSNEHHEQEEEEEEEDEEEEEEEEEEDKEEESLSGSSSLDDQKSGISLKDEPFSVQESVLAVPADDLEDLEWLSHFCEDSFSEFSLQHVTDDKNPQISPDPNRAEPPVSFNRPLTKSKRSKRSRATISRVWSVGSLPTTATTTTTTTPPTELSSLSSFSSCSSSSPASSSSNSCVTGIQAVVDLVRAAGKGKAAGPGRKQKRKLGGVEAPQRRCSHCGVVKTPQWRTGPNGAKTLCNACGVRFKSGRLLPEYRPACSPTFSSAVHSNNHRKVLEMRRKKEMVLLGPGLGPVQSF